jgi:hypothetical protein
MRHGPIACSVVAVLLSGCGQPDDGIPEVQARQAPSGGRPAFIAAGAYDAVSRRIADAASFTAPPRSVLDVR